jgi:hypothetical protein
MRAFRESFNTLLEEDDARKEYDFTKDELLD